MAEPQACRVTELGRARRSVLDPYNSYVSTRIPSNQFRRNCVTTIEQHFDVFIALHAVMNRYDHALLPFDATGRHPASSMDGNHATATFSAADANSLEIVASIESV